MEEGAVAQQLGYNQSTVDDGNIKLGRLLVVLVVVLGSLVMVAFVLLLTLRARRSKQDALLADLQQLSSL